MATTIAQVIGVVLIIGAIGALVFQLIKATLGCLVMGIVTVLILPVLDFVIQALPWLSHLLG